MEQNELQKIELLKEIVFNNIKHFGILIKNNYPELLKFINDKTPLLKDKKFKISQKIHWILNDLKEFPKCENPKCNKSLEDKFLSINRGYQKHCCDRCSQLDPKIAKKRELNIDKEKFKNAMKKYNEQYFIKTGYICSAADPKNIKKRAISRKRNRFEKYKTSDFGVCLCSFEEYLNAIENNIPIPFKCSFCNQEIQERINENWLQLHKSFIRCPYCFPKNGCSSNSEKEIFKFMKAFFPNLVIEHNKRILIENNNFWKTNKEIDIFIPELKIGIEYNGLFYHSIENTEKHYHLHKTMLSEKQGIKLIHVYEDEWRYNKKYIQNFLIDFINEKYDYTKYSYMKNNLLFIKRDKFNMCCKFDELQYIDSTSPTIEIRKKNNKEYYKVENSGYLIFKTKKPTAKYAVGAKSLKETFSY